MSREFNTAGPSVPGKHYMIDPLERIDFPEIERLIANERYFVLHAPRQTGKTTSLLALMHRLNGEGKYVACYANIEAAQTSRDDVARAVRTVCDAIASAAIYYHADDRLHAWTEEAWAKGGPDRALSGLLERWSRNSGRPIVLMLDEVDALVGDGLIAILRQIRAGYAQKPDGFPQTVILCGVRDFRDYRIHTAHKEIITGGSAFNIKAKSLRLGNFSRGETEALWRQHQEETGQPIDPAIFPELWEDTGGQPWLVNALGAEVTWEDRALRDRSRPITLEHYYAARERLIQERATHLDQLVHKLEEDRVRPIIAGILQGKTTGTTYPADDLGYVEDLGLIVRGPPVRIANRIYREVVPRELTSTAELTLTPQAAWYLGPDRRLDFPKLLGAFQQYFRENSETSIASETYREASAQLLLQTFLQRVVNGGGRIEREYALGSGRVDLCVKWPLDQAKGFHGPVQKVVTELKVVRDHDGRDRTVANGLSQVDRTVANGLSQVSAYADRLGADEAYLVVFDQRPGKNWDERIWQRTESHEGRAIGVWGM